MTLNRPPGTYLGGLYSFDSFGQARLVLEAGLTTVRDLDWISPTGNFCAELVALREAIAAGKVPGPRMVVGGFTQEELESAVKVKGGKRNAPPTATPGTI